MNINLNTAITLPFTKPSHLDVLLFTKHLATMMKAGIPVGEALDALADSAKSTSFRTILLDILESIRNGQKLAQALRKHPRIFNDFYVSLIEISEQSGTLDENLDFIAEQLAKDYSLKKKIQSASIYPMFVLLVSLVMGGFISFFILPQLVDFFSILDVKLPLTTQILLFVAHAFKDYGLIIAITFISLILTFISLIKTKFVKPSWDKFLLSIPFIGAFVQATQTAQFTRNMGVLVKSGIPIARAIDITGNTLSITQFQQTCYELQKAVTKGNSIAKTLSSPHHKHVSSLVVKMIDVGEKTGKLDDSLLYLGEFYEEEIDVMSKNLSTILEPILLLVIGLLVGFVALAIISPIYELSGSIRR